MPGIINRFIIENIHNRYTIDVPIRDNKLILVGENGTGKSTVANFIYLFITKQWNRIPAIYNFKSITAVIDSEEIEITKEELMQNRDFAGIMRKLNPFARQRLTALEMQVPISELINNPKSISKYAAQYNLPISFLEEYFTHVLSSEGFWSEKLERVKQMLKPLVNGKVLYLPTYRRVEQDLAAIFAGSEETADLRKTIDRLRHRTHSEDYVELVEFGMKDVEETILQTMGDLRTGFLADYNRLTSTYLSEVILGEYLAADPAEISELDELTINAVFNRIGQSLLSKAEQQMLRSNIEEIKTRNDSHTKVVVHYLKKLIELHKKQEEKEKDVREFVDVCNQYLSGKRFIYDNRNFEMTIRLIDLSNSNIALDQDVSLNKPDVLSMSQLSSGEKQIVSLFSQIYLSESSNYFVIIDEPELSLSVIWQKRFLPDIVNSGRCSGLIATTHSPYIFDNELDSYTYSIEKFRRTINVER